MAALAKFMTKRLEPIKNVRHDVYDSISPHAALKDSALDLRVLVTGAGRGIGRQTALYFALAGAKKVVVTARTQSELDETKVEIEKLGKGTEVRTVTGSITEIGDVEKVFDAAGDLDVLVHNAGRTAKFASLPETDPEEWWNVYEVNVKGTYLFNREFLRRVGSKEGKLSRPVTIVNISSRSGLSCFPGASSYSSSKLAVNKIVEYLASENEENLRVFALNPGAVLTKLAEGTLPPEAQKAALIDTVEVAAGAVLWAATSKDADFLNGRYLSAQWDVDELLSYKQKIIDEELLYPHVTGAVKPWAP